MTIIVAKTGRLMQISASFCMRQRFDRAGVAPGTLATARMIIPYPPRYRRRNGVCVDAGGAFWTGSVAGATLGGKEAHGRRPIDRSHPRVRAGREAQPPEIHPPGAEIP